MIRDFKYSVWLDDVFIRNIVTTTSCIGDSVDCVKRTLQSLYPNKWELLRIEREDIVHSKIAFVKEKIDYPIKEIILRA